MEGYIITWACVSSKLLTQVLFVPKMIFYLYFQSSHPSYTFLLIYTTENLKNGICAQRRLRSAWASAQSDRSPQSAWRKLRSLATYWTLSKDSDQTGRMPRLINLRLAHLYGDQFWHQPHATNTLEAGFNVLNFIHNFSSPLSHT